VEDASEALAKPPATTAATTSHAAPNSSAQTARFTLREDGVSLYVHLPYCVRKCRYCDFNSHGYTSQDLAAHVACILQEASLRAQDLAPQTVFFGGGTPTLLGAEHLSHLLDGLAEITGFRQSAQEVTMEANPESLTSEVASAILHGGVDRLSIGVQSLDNDVLAAYDRVHDAKEALAAYDRARAAGFRRINLDLIYAFPGQDPQQWVDTLHTVHQLGPEHLSCYELSYEPGTSLTRLRDLGRWQEEDPERCAALFDLTREQNAAAGYHSYEVSAFAQPGEECQHNLAYWRSLDYLGLGAGAASWRQGVRSMNLAKPEDYERAMGEGHRPLAQEEATPPTMRLFDHLMMGLRLEREGVSLERMKRQCGSAAVASILPRLQDFVARKQLLSWQDEEGEHFRATAQGLRMLDSLLQELLPEGGELEV